MSKDLQVVLQRTLEEYEQRLSEERKLQDYENDVELASRIQEQLEMEHEVTNCKKKLVEYELALEESRAVKAQRESVQQTLADQFVKEMWEMSRKFGELQSIRTEYEKMLIQHDEAVAKLIKTEDDLAEANAARLRAEERAASRIAPETHVPVSNENAAAVLVEPPQITKAASFPQPTKSSMNPKPIQKSIPGVIQELSGPSDVGPEYGGTTVALPPLGSVSDNFLSTNPTEVAAQVGNEMGNEDLTVASTKEKGPEDATAAVAPVTLEASSDLPMRLEGFETKILMHVFSFLDALDILNTAQVNVNMYSRVDSLFGLGNGAGASDGDNSTIATTETSANPVSTSARSPTPKAPPSMPSPTIAALPPPTNAQAFTPPRSGGMTMPQVGTPVAGTHRRTESTPSNPAAEGIRTIFSMLAPKTSTLSSLTTSTSPSRASSHKSPDAPPMNAAMANSLTQKLTDAELNAIVLMSTRLQQKIELADKLSREKEELVNTLNGTEGVKQYLIGKVRQMEEAMSFHESNESKVAQQIASDQEVIAFLDCRVQELERQSTEWKNEQETLRKEVARIKEQAEQKSMVMGDMLQFERDKWTESDREWKATKKVLVKEVRSCRAQIATLQAQKEGFRQQAQTLRNAILPSTNNTSGVN